MNHIYDEGLVCVDIQLCDEYMRNIPRSEKGLRLLHQVATHPLLIA